MEKPTSRGCPLCRVDFAKVNACVKIVHAAKDVLYKMHRADMGEETRLYPGEGTAVISARAWCNLRDAMEELDKAGGLLDDHEGHQNAAGDSPPKT
jgi:hypothetical protein